jgi:hypothetical protein
MVAQARLKINALPAVNRILQRARRYLRLSPTERPGPQPENISGIFKADEILDLMDARRWPLRRRDLQFVIGKVRPRPRPCVLHLRIVVIEAEGL